jgi:hypothetical protein
MYYYLKFKKKPIFELKVFENSTEYMAFILSSNYWYLSYRNQILKYSNHYQDNITIREIRNFINMSETEMILKLKTTDTLFSFLIKEALFNNNLVEIEQSY